MTRVQTWVSHEKGQKAFNHSRGIGGEEEGVHERMGNRRRKLFRERCINLGFGE